MKTNALSFNNLLAQGKDFIWVCKLWWTEFELGIKPITLFKVYKFGFLHKL